MKAIRTIILYGLIMIACKTQAQETVDSWEKWGPHDLHNSGWIFRVGYVIGGTSPIPLPDEIRSINGFSPLGGLTFGADYYIMFTRRLGLQAGVHFFWEGFHTSANVKNYRMGIEMGGNHLEGNFTGTDVTNTEMVGITIPITCTCRVSPRWNIGLGPFFSFVGKGTFEGEVYDNPDGIGYLREGDPTGRKIEITSDNAATYDFSGNMKHFYWGLEFMFEWKAMRHLNVFGAFDWSISSIFPSSFETIPFKMYPVYAKIGVGYRL